VASAEAVLCALRLFHDNGGVLEPVSDSAAALALVTVVFSFGRRAFPMPYEPSRVCDYGFPVETR